MASGLIICLFGQECKDKMKYTNLDKEYDFTVLVGFHTDSYDILGLVDSYYSKEKIATRERVDKTLDNQNKIINENEISEIVKILCNMKGKIKQKYPPYSSKTINGKQMFQIERDGEMDNVMKEIPQKEIEIYSMDIVGRRSIDKNKLLQEISTRTARVRGDFRQEEIIKTWQNSILDTENEIYVLLDFHTHVSSGTYIRSIVHQLSAKIGIPMCTYSIYRGRVGDWSL
jgi:tRNA pseudouridine55 synthase